MAAEAPFNPHDDLAERRSDQGVWNGFMGDAEAKGIYPENDNASRASGNKSPHRRDSRRGGRAYAEKSGRDVSRELSNQDELEHPMTPEERRAITARGMAMIEAVRNQLQIDSIVRQEREKTQRDAYDSDSAHRAEELAIDARMRTLHDRRQSLS